MELNKENTKKIIGILAFGISFYFILQNIVVVKNIIDNIIDILSPFLFGAGLAFIVNIPLKMFESKLFKPKKMKNGRVRQNKLKRPISILLSVIFIIIIITLIVKLIIPQIISVIVMFITDIPDIAYNIKEYAIELTKQYPDISEQIRSIEINWDAVTADSFKFIRNLASSLVTSSIGVVINIIGGIFNTIITIIFALYILVSKEKLVDQSKKFIQAYFSEKTAKYILEICSLSKKTFHNFITGQCIEAIILGGLCFVAMLILRIPFASTVSVLVGVTALVPIVGAIIGMVIGVILILSVSPIKALVFLISLLILQQIETNIIYPKIVGNSIGLPGIWVLLAVAVGGSLGGMLGLIIGLPLVSVMYTILKNDVKRRLKEKNA